MTTTSITGRLSRGVAIAAIALAGAAAATAATAQQNFTLRFNHVLGPTEPFHEGFEAWAKAVETRSNGRLKMQVTHSGQLGVEEDIIEQMRQGAAFGQNTDAARLGTYVKGIAVVNGPYLAESLEDVAKLSKSPSMIEWQKELAEKHGLKVLCFDWVQGFRHFFTNKPIRTPADLAGQRIRTPPAPIWQQSVRALGAAPVAMNFGEMYPAVQQKVIDGVELVYSNIPGRRFYEVLSHASETRHIMLVNFQVVGSRFFNGLPADLQAILTEECTKAGQATSAKIIEIQKGEKKFLIEKGMKVVEDVDIAAFKAAGDKAYEALGLTEAKNAVLKEIGKR